MITQFSATVVNQHGTQAYPAVQSRQPEHLERKKLSVGTHATTNQDYISGAINQASQTSTPTLPVGLPKVKASASPGSWQVCPPSGFSKLCGD